MTKLKYSPRYWNCKGKYQKEYDILWDKYVPAEGTNVLIDTKRAKEQGFTSKQIKDAKSSIKKLIRFSKKYYRFFNDGDSFTWDGIRYRYMRYKTAVFRELDKIADRLILDAWKKTFNAKMPTTKYL